MDEHIKETYEQTRRMAKQSQKFAVLALATTFDTEDLKDAITLLKNELDSREDK